MGGRCDKFIHIRIGGRFNKGVFLATVRIPEPCFAFGNIHFQGCFQRMELTAIGLYPRLETVFIAPLRIGFQETIPHDIHTGNKEVIPYTVYLFLGLAGQGRCQCSLDSMPHMPDFIEDKRQIRLYIISPAGLKLFQEIMAPVGPFQLHAVTKQSTEPFQVADSGEEFIRHPVEKLLHCLLVVMVQHWPGSTGSTVDNGLETGYFHQCIQDMFTFRQIDGDYVRPFLKRKVYGGGECRHFHRSQAEGV